MTARTHVVQHNNITIHHGLFTQGLKIKKLIFVNVILDRRYKNKYCGLVTQSGK
jgi:hypothetical protein